MNKSGGRRSGRQYNFVDLTGRVIGTLTVEGEAPSINGNSRWRCRCACGAKITMQGFDLNVRAKRIANETSSTACSRNCPARAKHGRRLA